MIDFTFTEEQDLFRKAAREFAETESLDLGKIKGTGAEGKITLTDVRKALKDQ